MGEEVVAGKDDSKNNGRLPMKSLYGGFLIVASCRTLHYRFVKQD
jgi:hypothetical protein